MALLPRISFTSLNNKIIIGNLQSVLLKSTQIDAIDDFTKNLIQNKTIKWQLFYKKLNKSSESTESNLEECNHEIFVENNHKMKYNISKCNNKKQLENFPTTDSTIDSTKSKYIHNEIIHNNIGIRGLNKNQVDELFQSTLKNSNESYFANMLNDFIKYKLFPSYKIIDNYLREYALKGNKEIVDNIIKFCENFDEKSNEWILTRISPLKGVLLWKCGRIEDSFAILMNGYEFLKNEKINKIINYELCHWAFKEIIKDTFKNKSEAVLILLIKNGNIIYNNYNDIYIISWIWKQCFNSDWYSDQKLALEIFQNNENLRELVYKRTSSLCFQFLRENSIDSVYRLIELCLKFNRKDACKDCLNQLFLYQYWRKDFRSCTEIIKYSKELNISLEENHSEKLFNIILDRYKGKYIVNTPKVKQFEYKF